MGAGTVLSFTSAEISTHCLALQCCVVLIYRPDRGRGGYLHKHGLTTSDYIMQMCSYLHFRYIALVAVSACHRSIILMLTQLNQNSTTRRRHGENPYAVC